MLLALRLFLQSVTPKADELRPYYEITVFMSILVILRRFIYGQPSTS